AIKDAVGTRSHLVLIDSALGKPVDLGKADDLTSLPQTEATDTEADMPALMQAALDYISTNKSGRTDVWVLSDLQQSDWEASDGRWGTLRSAFLTMQGVRFHLLCYPQPAQDDLGITIDHVTRHETSEKTELQLDLRITRHVEKPQPLEVPLRFVINGVATTMKVTIKENQLVMQALSIPISQSVKRGWGRVELPDDAWAGNNVFYFVFDEAPAMHSAIVSDDEAESGPLNAALSAAADPSRKYVTTVLSAKRAAEIPWDDTALIVWQAPLPKADDAIARQLRDHVAAGRTIIFLPPESPDNTRIFGLGWGSWKDETQDKPKTVEWWRNDSDLLANTRDGSALPVGSLEISRFCGIEGDGVPLARVAGGLGPLLMRSLDRGGNVYFLGTLPGPGSSSLARDGVVMFALLHRALNEGATSLGKAQQRFATATALGADPSKWKPVEQKGEAVLPANLPLRAGVVSAGDNLIALNRPPGEDQPQILSEPALNELFAGLDFHVLTNTLEDGHTLTNEVWRTFLIAMALALLGEALLCMPSRREIPVMKNSMGVTQAAAEGVSRK
ncbi:MAG: hypothetical protein WCD79_04350, partial [Chthoniobacteraceae bacterium]